MIGPKNLLTAISIAKVWTNVGKRKRSAEGVGGGGAGVVPVPSSRSDPARAINIQEVISAPSSSVVKMRPSGGRTIQTFVIGLPWFTWFGLCKPMAKFQANQINQNPDHFVM